MRKWRAENREKNRQNDLRCRVYRLARQKYGEHDSTDKQAFVREEIARRLGRRMMMERRESNGWAPPLRMRDSLRLMSPVLQYLPTSPSSPSSPTSPSSTASSTSDIIELPFYSAPQQKIELPSIDRFTRTNSWSSSPPDFSSASSSPVLPHLSPSLQRRTSSSSISSVSSVTSDNQNNNNNNKRRRSSSYHSATPVPTSKKAAIGSNKSHTKTTTEAVAQEASTMSLVKVEGKKAGEVKDDFCVLPSMHAFLSYNNNASSSSPAAEQQQQQQQKNQQQQQEQCCIPTITTKGGIKYVDSNKILDEFVGVVLNYVDNATVAQ